MTLALRQSTGTKQVANVRVLTGSGLEDAFQASARTAIALKRFFSSFVVSVSETVIMAGFNSGGSSSITSQPVGAIVSGAVGAVTYLWTQTGGDAMTITDPASAETAFEASVSPGSPKVGTFKCTVSDAGGHSADTPIVTVTLRNIYGGLL